MTGAVDVDVVVPSVGRPSLLDLLSSLATADGPLPRVVVVDDRAHADGPLLPRAALPGRLADAVTVVASGGRGPAAARNVGWRHSRAAWVAFLDDDVVVPPGWLRRLADDLAAADPDVAGTQGRIRVPLPSHRPATDWERNVAGLETARWATADLAYRRDALLAVGGFDERFPRAYREDADLGLRITAAGWRIGAGSRWVEHPVRAAGDAVSLRLQAGNADDPLMRALHGPDWRRRAGVPRGRRPWHLATTAAAATAGVAAAAGHRRSARWAAGAWTALTIDFAARRILPGPRSTDEVVRMAWTSTLLPLAATWHWLRGLTGLPRRLARPGPVPTLPGAVLFDRDGTLIHDVPYNGDPALVEPVDGARAALDRLRWLGIPIGVVSNQSGIGRGLIDPAEVAAVNDRVDELLGPFDVWAVCPHAPDDGCACRKPEPLLVKQAAAAVGVDARDCVVIGDIGADVEAARNAGARPILVPTDATLAAEVTAAPEVADTLADAVERALAGPRVAVAADGGAA